MTDVPNKPLVETPVHPSKQSSVEAPRPIEIPKEPEQEPTFDVGPAPEEPAVPVERTARRAAPANVSGTSAPPAAPSSKDPLTQKIEDAMTEDMTDVFLGLSPQKQQEFKAKGEETAAKIREMIQSAKINAKKIFELIKDWLKVIPGVNRFFLEQEAKIKTDKIVNLKP